MIKISGKVDQPTLTTDSVIFRSLSETELHQNETHFNSDEVLFPINNKILLNPLSVLVDPLFYLFQS